MDREPGCPPPQGLYDPRHEKDACGVGFVVNVKGVRSHSIVKQALQLLVNLLHRGACGCEVNTGDGAGIIIQMPDKFLRKEARNLGITLPPAGEYGAGCVFLPRDPSARATIEALIEKIVHEEGQTLLGWRDLPTDDRLVGASAAAVEPYFKQIFVGAGADLKVSTTKSRYEERIRQCRPSGRPTPRSSGSSTSSASASSMRSTSCRSRWPTGSISTSRASRRTR